MPTIREKQSKLAHNLALLILFAEAAGYEVTLGQTRRCRECKVGHPKSLHKIGLAVDLNLFRAGRYITDEEGHRELADIWESMGGSAGIRFRDPNHYSIEHAGVR